MPLILRNTKGSPLTYNELDGNFTYLSQSISSKIVVNPSPSKVGIFYVQKLYSGSISSSFTNATTYTSANTDYLNQIATAVVNSTLYPYPDPYSALIAAKLGISAGSYTSAIINIVSPTVWTVGDADPTKNGSANGSSSTNTVADFGFVSSMVPSNGTSLLYDNVYYNWCKGSGLTLINNQTDYPVFLSSGSDAVLRSGFYGQGTFTCVYGDYNGIAGTFAKVDNSLANLVLNADQMVMNQYDPLVFTAFDQIDLYVRSFKSYNTNVVHVESRRVGGSSKPQFNASFDHIVMSDRQNIGIGPNGTNYWNGLYIGGGSSQGGLFDVKVGNYFLDSAVRGNYSTNAFAVTYLNSGPDALKMQNSDVNISIDNLYQQFDNTSNTYANYPIGSKQYSICTFGNSTSQGSQNNNVFINLRNAYVEGIIGNQNCSPAYMGTNYKVKFKCDNCLRYFTTYSGVQPSIYLSNYAGSDTSNNKNSGVIYEGTYSNVNGPVVYTDYTYFSGLVNKHMFTGVYKVQTSGSAMPVFYFPVTNVVSVALKDAILMTNTSSLCINTQPGHSIYSQNVVSNVTASANALLEPGGLTVLTNLDSYIM